MQHASAGLPPSLCLVVALDEQLSTNLQMDLQHAGLRTLATSQLLTHQAVPARASAIVWLADDFPALAVAIGVRNLRSSRPGIRLVLISNWPDELGALLDAVAVRPTSVLLREPHCSSAVIEALVPGPDVTPS